MFIHLRINRAVRHTVGVLVAYLHRDKLHYLLGSAIDRSFLVIPNVKHSHGSELEAWRRNIVILHVS